MRAFALFVEASQVAEGEAALASVFGSPQTGCFRQLLSASGSEPATHRGAYAANLTTEQAQVLMGQEHVTWVESSWPSALASRGLQVID